MPNHMKMLMQPNGAPITNSPGEEAEWPSWGPAYTSTMGREAGAHGKAEAFSCDPEDGEKGVLKGQGQGVSLGVDAAKASFHFTQQGKK